MLANTSGARIEQVPSPSSVANPLGMVMANPKSPSFALYVLAVSIYFIMLSVNLLCWRIGALPCFEINIFLQAKSRWMMGASNPQCSQANPLAISLAKIIFWNKVNDTLNAGPFLLSNKISQQQTRRKKREKENPTLSIDVPNPHRSPIPSLWRHLLQSIPVFCVYRRMSPSQVLNRRPYLFSDIKWVP